MRIEEAAGGSGLRSDPFTFEWDGQTITAYPGETILGALLASGYGVLRYTYRRGEPRRMFCGMGACFDCLVEVDGRSNRQACLMAARPGMVVRTQRDDLERPVEDSRS